MELTFIHKVKNLEPSFAHNLQFISARANESFLDFNNSLALLKIEAFAAVRSNLMR